MPGERQEGGVRESDKSWRGFQQSDRGGTEWHSKEREAFEESPGGKSATVNHGDGRNGFGWYSWRATAVNRLEAGCGEPWHPWNSVLEAVRGI